MAGQFCAALQPLGRLLWQRAAGKRARASHRHGGTAVAHRVLPTSSSVQVSSPRWSAIVPARRGAVAGRADHQDLRRQPAHVAALQASIIARAASDYRVFFAVPAGRLAGAVCATPTPFSAQDRPGSGADVTLFSSAISLDPTIHPIPLPLPEGKRPA